MSVSQPRPFRGSRWFKGNLHAHTELSDGALSPARVVEIYKKHNYDFLAVTDHDLYDACPELSDEDFLILPGGEFAINNLRGERTPQRPEHSFDIVFYLKDPDFPNRLPAGYRFRDPRGSEGFDARLREHRRFADDHQRDGRVAARDGDVDEDMVEDVENVLVLRLRIHRVVERRGEEHQEDRNDENRDRDRGQNPAGVMRIGPHGGERKGQQR